jgi:hypothetical protein
MTRGLEVAGGGSAWLLSIEGENGALETERAWPPGSTVELVVAGAPLRLKVRQCRRFEDEAGPEGKARFRVEGRWVNLSRAQREDLSAR